ncbi:MAG: hypothetical protein ACRDJW_09140 [Thermomicrobiales bacterium]
MATLERRSQPAPTSRSETRHRAAAEATESQSDGGAVYAYASLIAQGIGGAANPAFRCPRPMDAASVVMLQRTHGNAHVNRMLDRTRATAVVIQRAIGVDEAKRWIKKASAGAGTDEEKIYEAIRQCSNRAALKADPEVQRLLKSEMKGHDLWKAQLLLEFGKESAFPPTVRAIWGATKGWGTDEERIYKAIDKLTAGQLDELLKIPGLKEILKADLNKGEMKRATGGAGVVDRHKKNVAFVKNELAEMKKPGSPTLIRNSAEWVEPASGAPKIELIILTKTHDAPARAKHHGKTGDVAYFGEDQKYPDDSADYDLRITSTRNINFTGATFAGEHQDKKIWLMEPKKHGRASVRGTLVHEIQHDADKHEKEPDWAKAYKSPEESWVRYKTEFRAYWIDGDFDRNSVTSGTATDPKFDNAKQEAIYLHLWGDADDDTYAEWLRPNYRTNPTVGGRKFQDLIHGYTHPEGVNLINSVRIDDLYNTLATCKKSDRHLTRSPLKELKAAAQALNEGDRLYVQSSRAAALQKMMKDNLAAKPLKAIAKIVGGGTLPKWV